MNHVVLFQPEIPQNTGNIMRSCIAVNAHLHLIKPLGFSLEEKYVKRSAANYMEHLSYTIYETMDEFFEKNEGQFYFLTRYGFKAPSQMNFENTLENHYFIFGSESTGLPKPLLKKHLDRCFRLPMSDKIRSLNLANTVAIVLYEAMRQQNYEGLEPFEPEIYKGADFLKE